jgi:hypothetical protein
MARDWRVRQVRTLARTNVPEVLSGEIDALAIRWDVPRHTILALLLRRAVDSVIGDLDSDARAEIRDLAKQLSRAPVRPRKVRRPRPIASPAPEHGAGAIPPSPVDDRPVQGRSGT